ncbi:MAG: hypothetical protein V3U76_01115 [Granulosicoccus sp.]
MSQSILLSGNGGYVQLTAIGAYYAVQSNETELYRGTLLRIMQADKSFIISDDTLRQYTGLESSEALAHFYKLEKTGFITANATQERITDRTLDELLGEALRNLSDLGQVILADSGRGFYLGYSGFSASEAEELAVLSSSIRTIYVKNETLLRDKLSMKESAFGIINPAGHSELGFWPLFIGSNVFTLIISGLPQFNRPDFARLVWLLVQRYGKL